MTAMQIVALCSLAVVAAVVYLPGLMSQLKRTPDSMSQIRSVLAIRDGATSPEVRKACTVLLEALLK